MPPFYHNRCVSNGFLSMFHSQYRSPLRYTTAAQVPAAVVSLVCTSTTPTRLRSAGTFYMAIVPTPPSPAISPMTPSRNVLLSVFILRTTGGVLGRIVRSLTFAWASDMAFVATLQYSGIVPKVSIVRCNMSGSVQTLRKRALVRPRDASFRMLSVQIAAAKYRLQRGRPRLVLPR